MKSRRITRDDVLGALVSGPKFPREIARALGVKSGPIRKHLFRAAADNQVEALPDGRYSLVNGESHAGDEFDDNLDWISEERTLRPRGRKAKQADGEDEEPRSHPKTEPRGLTVRTEPPEETWPAEKVYSLVKDNLVLGWVHGTNERPAASLVNELAAEFLAGRGLPPVFPRGFQVNPKGLPALLAAAYQEGLECGRAWAKEAREEAARCQRCAELATLQARVNSLEAQAAQWEDRARQAQAEAKRYQNQWLAAQREAGLKEAAFRKRIAELERRLNRLYPDKTRRELCTLLGRVTAALERERAAHQETKSRWLNAEDRAWKAEHGLLTGGQIEEILWRQLNIQLARSIMKAFQ